MIDDLDDDFTFFTPPQGAPPASVTSPQLAFLDADFPEEPPILNRLMMDSRLPVPNFSLQPPH